MVQVLFDLCDYVEEIGVLVIYFVDVGQVWYMVFVGLVLDCFGLWFDFVGVVEYYYCVIEYVQ